MLAQKEGKHCTILFSNLQTEQPVVSGKLRTALIRHKQGNLLVSHSVYIASVAWYRAILGAAVGTGTPADADNQDQQPSYQFHIIKLAQ